MQWKQVAVQPLEKSYSIAVLPYKGEEHIVVAAEKVNKCLLFTKCGELVEEIWSEPGGTMSIVPVPNGNGSFLATHKFYSPNDSAQAQIVYVRPKEEGGWQVTPIVSLPFVHRFDLLQAGGRHYLVACTLKSAHEYKDDWREPGAIYIGEVLGDFSAYSLENPFPLTKIAGGLLKNHGYCKIASPYGDRAVVGTANGVYCITAPNSREKQWQVEQVLQTAVSDMAFVDWDGDGLLEMITIEPFHGDKISIYKWEQTGMNKVYELTEGIAFAHGIWAGVVGHTPVAFIGCRGGERNTYAFTFDGTYHGEIIEQGKGAANILTYLQGETTCVVATNRECDEIGFYEVIE